MLEPYSWVWLIHTHFDSLWWLVFWMSLFGLVRVVDRSK